MVLTGSIFTLFSDNAFVVLIASILSFFAIQFLYQSYLTLKYPEADIFTIQDILIPKSVGIFALLGIMWVFVFAIITMGEESLWGIFMVPVFGSFGVSCLWFFGTIRKYANSYKWILILIGILFTILYFPITLMRIIRPLIF